MKPIMHQDHLNSPGSDEGCHANLHQERRAPSTEPYPVWNQDGYPLRSFTPPYQRQHESSDSGQADDRSVFYVKHEPGNFSVLNLRHSFILIQFCQNSQQSETLLGYIAFSSCVHSSYFSTCSAFPQK